MQRLIALALLLMLLIFPVSAHPGRTDGNGGHYDRETGTYHYHHGFPAHQHYDTDGDGLPNCPYNFKDMTGQSSGSGSTMEKEKPEKKGSGAVFSWAIIAILLLLLWRSSRKRKEEEVLYQDHLKHKETVIKDLTDGALEKMGQIDSLKAENQELRDQIVNIRQMLNASDKVKSGLQEQLDTIQSLADSLPVSSSGAPNSAVAAALLSQKALLEERAQRITALENNLSEHIKSEKTGIFYADDGLPIYYNASSKKYGDYTAYINIRTSMFHMDPKCAPYDAKITHLFDVPFSCRACSKCAAGVSRAVPGWYTGPKGGTSE